MELRQLTYFLAAAQTQNFRKAAELCIVAQPALSRQIAALEEELGVELFQRVKQRVVLTSAGQEFATYVRNALDLLQQGQQEMVRFQEGLSGTVLIGSNESLATAFLPTIFATFHQRYPQILLSVHGGNTDEVIALVEQGEVDLGLIFDPMIHSEIVTVKELFRQPLRLLVSPSHPLAQAPTHTITLERIVTEQIFLLGKRIRLRKVLERIFAQRALNVQPAVEIDSVDGLKELVRLGTGVAFTLPALHPSMEDDLILLPIADLSEEFIFALVYRSVGSMSPAARRFISVIMETVARD